MHSSRRDAFKTIGDIPLAKITKGEIEIINTNYNKRNLKRSDFEIHTKIDEKVGLVYFYPGLQADIIDYHIDKKYSGLVIAGTGLGHTSHELIKSFKRAKDEEIPIFMTSQCYWGYVGMNVYETGRILLKEGIIPLSNMLPEAALVKAMWVLGQTHEIPFVKELMQKNLAGEITERETYDEFLIFQAKTNEKISEILEKEN